ncbi:MAG: LysR family transcriptional regulator [Alphaproteobacteria bacterium]|nr:LysR family transcriptional regulator [Alphaproteobacteria bacterium]MCZ6840902.1 LysR family transcriptional regulator [Alphaproteobacteria bacterium]
MRPPAQRGTEALDLRHIRSFIAVYEEGSINRAATRLHCAQPSLSLQLRNLENSLSVELFVRHARGARPTAAAERFYKHCLSILGEVESAEQHMRDWAREIAGALTVGLIPTVAKSVLPQVLPDYTERFPNVDIRVVEAFSGTLTDWVVSGELDFAIVTEPPSHEGLVLRALSAEPLALVSGAESGFTHLAPVRLPELPPIKLVMPSQQHSLRGMLERYIRVGDIAVERLLEIDGLFGALEFIHKSDWSAILPVSTVVDEMDSGKFVVNPIDEPAMMIEYYLIHQTQRPLVRASRELVDNIETALKQSAADWSGWQKNASAPRKRRTASRQNKRQAAE